MFDIYTKTKNSNDLYKYLLLNNTSNTDYIKKSLLLGILNTFANRININTYSHAY